MADIEKVIKGLEYCIKSEDCRGCIYWEEIGLHEGCPLNSDALELLKEQKRVIECLKGKVKKYELEKSWEESPDRMSGCGWE